MASGLLLRAVVRDAADDRTRVKDDFKLIAQCQCENITHLLSEDAGTLTKYAARLQADQRGATQTVLLKDGFDMRWFDNGQGRLLP